MENTNVSYQIVRMYFREKSRIVKKGLTLEEAQAHCQNPETSWKTCKLPHNIRRTKRKGHWFDGYEEQR